MRYLALACDYDGTLATVGRVDARTLRAVERLKASGRRFLLVTGRVLDELLEIFPEATKLCDRLVVENGAIVYNPTTRESTPFANKPPVELRRSSGDRGCLRRKAAPSCARPSSGATRFPSIEGTFRPRIRTSGMETLEPIPEERPRERLLRLGAEALKDDELLALVTASGLTEQCGLDVARELARRYDARGKDASDVSGPRQVYDHLQPLRHKRKEHFVALYVNARNRLMHVETVSIGTLTASLVHPREVFGPAVERAAAGVIVAHNHPSGDPRPSAEDHSATRRLERAGRILGVPLLDHVVVGESGYYSFREEGGLCG